MAGRSQVERCLAVVELLFSHVLDGMSNKALARQLGESEVNICRDLAALEKAGWVQKLPSGLWALTTKPVALMRLYNLFLNDWRDWADAFDARVNAQARQMGR